MAKSAASLITMLRNVTGRVDASDPQFSDPIMLQFLQDFIQLESSQDIRIFKNKTFYEFTLDPTTPNPVPIVLNTLVLDNGHVGATTIEPPCYANGFFVYWYQSPQEFYQIWPETQTYTPQRPTYVLYYNNELNFKGPPDQSYLIKMVAYQMELQILNSELNDDYLFRYVVYGAALDIFSDYGEMDKWREIFPAYTRYRALVYSRTHSQYQNQRPAPEF